MYILILIWAIAINWLAAYKGFYTLPKPSPNTDPNVSTRNLFLSFGLYLGLSLLFLPILAKLILLFLMSGSGGTRTLPITAITGLQFGVTASIFLFLVQYFRSKAPSMFSALWKNRKGGSNSPAEFDFGLGVLTWFLCFPIVTVLSELVDRMMKSFFGLQEYEQAAVKYVKIAMSQPFSLVFALLSVLVLAPLIEEFLFRGLLQTYFKKRLGRAAAILLSALAFAFFHYSPVQGLGNVSLIFALFLLGGFLGFIYERQKSLWAPIGLHMSFNAISAIRILFIPEIS